MRFKAHGPAIPDILLKERDAGKVVFLCGAGVSIPAGLPGFAELAKHVIDEVDPPQDSEIRQAFRWLDKDLTVPEGLRRPGLDDIFQLLNRDYGRELVAKAVWEQLADPLVTPTREHAIVARLSANVEGQPQVVTTNFDRLFESALTPALAKKTPIYKPPMYPDLRHDVPATGITYLHGRRADDKSGPHDYLLSSADLGRAYLAEGWATTFIRQLLQHYTVVLLGYRAEDPPVQYLLQGLEGAGGQTADRLFAFDQGLREEVEAKWRDRGVRAIPYGDDHGTLWETLGAWADCADNPTAWRTAVVESSAKGPRELAPHERGIVAHLVRTSIGAKQFADRQPAPPAEWLCVFDAACRYAEPRKRVGEEANTFDPLEAYGLDDDPPRPGGDNQREGWPGDDLIAWHHGDDSVDRWQRLSGVSPPADPMPRRLHHLARWLKSCVHDPALAWWVARQPALHPQLHGMLKQAVEDDAALDDHARHGWMILFEALESGLPRSINLDPKLSDVQRRIKNHGWTSGVIRAFEAATEPVFAVNARDDLADLVRQSSDNWSTVRWKNVATFNVSFPALGKDLPTVADSALDSVYAALERNLMRASERLREIGEFATTIFDLQTFYPTEDSEHLLLIEQDEYVRWFRELLDRLAVVAVARDRLGRHIALWPDPDPLIFDRLRLYVWNKRELFSGDEAAKRVLDLSDAQFWQAEPRRSEHRRELMFLLRDRWTDFAAERRDFIGRRILNGPPARQDDDEAERTFRSKTAAIRFGWLLKEGCTFPASLHAEWTTLKSSLPAWRGGWVDDAVSTNVARAYWVGTNEDASVLDGVPIPKIAEVARERSGTFGDPSVENRPFVGLVESRPRRAILALASAGQKEFPKDLWRSAILHWPNCAPRRATKLLLVLLSRLPCSTIVELRYELGTWLRDQFPGVAADDQGLAYGVFDHIVECLVSGGSATTEGASGIQTIGREPVQEPTYTDAIEAPIGKAAEGLLKVLAAGNIEKGAELPQDFKTRLERLLTAPGEGAGHAVCILSRRIGRLNHLDCAWVAVNMIPWFHLDHAHSKSAWSGILWQPWRHVQPVFDAIKASFLALPSGMYTWTSTDETKQYCCWIVEASLLAGDDGPRLSFEEARDCLRKINGKGRQHVIWVLSQVGAQYDDGWSKLVVSFIQRVWPNERTYQTSETTEAWLSLLEKAEDSFPNVLDVVRDHLVAVDPWQVALAGEAIEQLAKHFPQPTLDLLNRVVPEETAVAPYGLSSLLTLLGEAEPALIGDARYRRFHRLAARR